MKTAKITNIPFVAVDDIIDAEVAPAIRSFIGKLRSAAEQDAKLTKHRDEADPAAAAEMYDATFAAAVAGDAAAERRVYDFGPKERLVERQQQIWNVREQARHNAATANIDLFNAAGLAAVPAVERAQQIAQAQHRSILRTIGEVETDSKTIATNVGWRLHSLNGLGENCRYHEGALAVLETARFSHIVLGTEAA
jgi:hypothetical protein